MFNIHNMCTSVAPTHTHVYSHNYTQLTPVHRYIVCVCEYTLKIVYLHFPILFPVPTTTPTEAATTQVNPCQYRRNLPNGQIQQSTQAGGTVLFERYTCSPGYELIGSTEAVCIPPQGWTSELPICRAIGKQDVYTHTGRQIVKVHITTL